LGTLQPVESDLDGHHREEHGERDAHRGGCHAPPEKGSELRPQPALPQPRGNQHRPGNREERDHAHVQDGSCSHGGKDEQAARPRASRTSVPAMAAMPSEIQNSAWWKCDAT